MLICRCKHKSDQFRKGKTLMKLIQKGKSEKGFTIIEVVLVLAIAGLIFLMVFIALPALQRNQRDTQRKNDLSRVQSAINSYQSNNRGAVPSISSDSALATFKSSYLTVGGDTFADPSGPAYVFTAGTVGTLPTGSSNTIYYFANAKCNGENTVAGDGSSKVAVSLKLEGGGVYCLNN